jgi:hypothetical protein
MSRAYIVNTLWGDIDISKAAYQINPSCKYQELDQAKHYRAANTMTSLNLDSAY